MSWSAKNIFFHRKRSKVAAIKFSAWHKKDLSSSCDRNYLFLITVKMPKQCHSDEKVRCVISVLLYFSNGHNNWCINSFSTRAIYYTTRGQAYYFIKPMSIWLKTAPLINLGNVRNLQMLENRTGGSWVRIANVTSVLCCSSKLIIFITNVVLLA